MASYTKIASLIKGLEILNIIGSSATPKMAKDVAQEANITYSTAMNNIITLEEAGYIEKQGQGYIGTYKLANFWSNRMSYLKRKSELIEEEIKSLEIAQ